MDFDDIEDFIEDGLKFLRRRKKRKRGKSKSSKSRSSKRGRSDDRLPETRKSGELFEAHLSVSPEGPDSRFSVWNDGARYEVEIRVRDAYSTLDTSIPVSVVVDGVKTGTFRLAFDGQTRFRRTEADGPLGFTPASGLEVALGQDGLVLMHARLQRAF